jgi:hypothetical protein
MRSKAFSPGVRLGAIVASFATALAVATLAHAETSIFGKPKTTATAQRWWAFQAWATDTDHRPVRYTIRNKPWWASFDSRYGHLYGVPPAASIGTYSNIVITATDGVSSASLPPFSLTVHPLNPGGSTGGSSSSSGGSSSSSGGSSSSSGGSSSSSGGSSSSSGGSSSSSGSSSGSGGTTGSATVNWTPPLQNTDGSTLSNLAGYTISYGTNANQLTSTVQVTNPGLTSYVIENLPAGTYYFGVASYNSSGQASSTSNLVSTTIQ